MQNNVYICNVYSLITGYAHKFINSKDCPGLNRWSWKINSRSPQNQGSHQFGKNKKNNNNFALIFIIPFRFCTIVVESILVILDQILEKIFFSRMIYNRVELDIQLFWCPVLGISGFIAGYPVVRCQLYSELHKYFWKASVKKHFVKVWFRLIW